MANQQDFLCVTLDTVPGRNVQQVLGMVWGIGENTFAASDDMESTAKAKGANAVVGVRRDTIASRHTGAPHEYFFYGTAVILE